MNLAKAALYLEYIALNLRIEQDNRTKGKPMTQKNTTAAEQSSPNRTPPQGGSVVSKPTPAAQEAEAMAALMPNAQPRTPTEPAKPVDRAKASKAELLSIAAILRVLEKLPDPQARGRVLKYVCDVEMPSV